MAATIKYLVYLDVLVYGSVQEDTEKVIKELEKIMANGN